MSPLNRWCVVLVPMPTDQQSPPELRRNKWARLCRDLRELPLREAGRLVAQKASKGLRTRKAEQSARNQIARVQNDPGALLSGGMAFSEYVRLKFTSLRGFPITHQRAEEAARIINDRFPDWRQRCLERANGILQDRMSLLGHEVSLGNPTAWWRDHVNGLEWSRTDAGARGEFRMPEGGDIKFIWELSRFQQGVALGRAFALSRDDRFARKFCNLFEHWRGENPFYVGPNWTCTMEVAIRAVNLLWSAGLLASSAACDAATQQEWVKSLLVHAIFIRHNLEYATRVVDHSVQAVNGNHYLANLAGLLHLSCAFPECRYAPEWQDFATRELFAEIRSQVDDEGVHWEYSPSYHRLVLEMILHCLIVLEREGKAIPEDITNRAIRMLEFIHHYRKPGGAVPLVRDVDSGRFLILGDDELANHDHMLAVGAIEFNRPDLSPGTLYEDCFWLFGDRALKGDRVEETVSAISTERVCEVESQGKVAQPASKLFRQSGFAVMRDKSQHLFAVCAPKGMQGYCGHTHNDFLSFELEAYGRTFLTDCGSYVYTQSPEWRNRFRSTASHNTVMVDDQEQNQFSASELFEIDSSVQPKILRWESKAERDVLDAAYTITLPSGARVTHERRFALLKSRAMWLIRDRITGAGSHMIETRFQFSDALAVEPAGQGIYRTLCKTGPNLVLKTDAGASVQASVETGWVSNRYAAKIPIQTLRFSQTAELPIERCYLLIATPGEPATPDLAAPDWKELCSS
jgi:uncharacterized heparinase superfamily protein